MLGARSVSKEYARVARCMGHSSTVRALDWSVDSSVLQSVSADLELLHWNARTGKQVGAGARLRPAACSSGARGQRAPAGALRTSAGRSAQG